MQGNTVWRILRREGTMIKTKKGPTKPTTMRIPDDLRARLQVQAEKENRTETNLVVTLIKEGLERRKA
jgi:hypothetical protein